MARNTGDATKDCKGREVEIGAFALPSGYEAVYFIALK
jgi:hypothetical protein